MRCGPLLRVIRGPMPTSLSEAVVLSTDVVAREGEVKECILRQPGPLFLSPCPYLQSCVLGAATLDGLRVRCGPGARAQLEQAPATPWIRLYYPLPWSRRIGYIKTHKDGRLLRPSPSPRSGHPPTRWAQVLVSGSAT